MSWSADVFFPAFADAGMLETAVYHAVGGDVPVQIGFVQPDALMLGDMAQSTEYAIEYQTTDMPALKMGETITIGVDTYKVRRNPEKKGDGAFSHVLLTKL